MFNLKEFMPHGSCYLWKTDILIMHVVSDLIISTSYLFIPIGILYILKKRKDIPLRSILVLFMLFITFCGLSHILEVVSVWYPIYYISGIMKIATAIVSFLSCLVFLKNIQKIIDLPSLQAFNEFFLSNMDKVIQKLPVGVIFSDNEGKINYCNDYVENVFNYKKAELYNSKVEQLIQEDIREKHINFREDYIKNPQEKSMGGGRILKGLTSNNETIDLEIGLRPISLSKDESMILIALMDVTEQEKIKKEMEKALKLVQIATYGMPSLLSYIDKNGIYRFVNEAYTRKWQVEENNIIGQNYKDFLPKETIKIVEEKMNNALLGEELNFKIQVNLPSEGLRDLDVFYIPHKSKNDKILGVIVLAHDITELNKTLCRLEISNKQLEEYAFLVSHDLRAPVRHISNFAELLSERLNEYDIEDKKIEKYKSIITSNCSKMQDMISGMLKISSIQNITPHKEKIDLNDIVTNLADDYKKTIDFEFIIDSETIIESDKQLLDAIFINLFENSYSNRKLDHNKAKVSLNIKQYINHTEIEYMDNGTGISEDFIEKIFNPFTKGAKSQGLGLGMTIVSRSLERISGSIKCLPNSNGAHFKISLKNSI